MKYKSRKKINVDRHTGVLKEILLLKKNKEIEVEYYNNGIKKKIKLKSI